MTCEAVVRWTEIDAGFDKREKPGMNHAGLNLLMIGSGRGPSSVSRNMKNSPNYLRWRILLRIFRFFRPSLRRPLPVFLTPIPRTLPSFSPKKCRDRSPEPRTIAGPRVSFKEELPVQVGSPPEFLLVPKSTVAGNRGSNASVQAGCDVKRVTASVLIAN